MQIRNSISLNVINQTLANRNAIVSDLVALGGGALITDELGDAISLADRLVPDRAVVYRRFRTDDKELFSNGTDPVAWFNQTYAPEIYVQAMNEPVVTAENAARFVNWNLAVIQEAKRSSRRVTVGTFAVGNPHEEMIASGAFDPLIRALDWQRVLMVHEYFRDDPAREFPWLVGRIAFWLKRAKEIGAPIRRVFVGECGRDVGGGKSDGWRDTGWSVEGYVDRLRAMMSIYDSLSDIYGVQIEAMIFCAGRGADGDWQSFNVEKVKEIYDFCRNHNQNAVIREVREDIVSFDWGSKKEQVVTSINGMSVNIRPEPNTSRAPIGSMKLDWRGMVYANEFISGGNRWRQIDHEGGQAYVAGNYVTFADPPAPEPDPIPDPEAPPMGLYLPGVTRDELQQMATLHTQISLNHGRVAEFDVQLRQDHAALATLIQSWLDRDA